MSERTSDMVLTFSEDELSYVLLSVRFMNHQLPPGNGHTLTEEGRQRLEMYLGARKAIRSGRNQEQLAICPAE